MDNMYKYVISYDSRDIGFNLRKSLVCFYSNQNQDILYSTRFDGRKQYDSHHDLPNLKVIDGDGNVIEENFKLLLKNISDTWYNNFIDGTAEVEHGGNAQVYMTEEMDELMKLLLADNTPQEVADGLLPVIESSKE